MDLEKLDVDGPDRRYRVSYAAFGDPKARRTVVCVHGLTRNGRDFDALAERLAAKAFVVCPDVVGRGQSDWLDDPDAYAVPTYADHMLQLIRHLGVSEVDWIGTSMGGLIGMGVAAMEDSPIRRLVLNDVGPFIPKEAMERIGDYLGLELTFDDKAALESHLRLIHAPFGSLTDEQWAHLVDHSAKRRDDGQWVLSYDPKIGIPFKAAAAEDVDLWSLWETIRCPTLVLRGAASDLLLEETAERMISTGYAAELITIDGAGHAPALMAPDQVERIESWLFKT